MKTNKAFMSRVRKTKKGALLVRRKGIRHFNAKASRKRQLNKKRPSNLTMATKTKQRYLLTK